MRDPFRHAFNVTVVILLGIYVITAMGYNPTARLMPLVVSIPILVLAVLQLIRDFRSETPKPLASEKRGLRTEGVTPPMAAGESRRKEFVIFLWAISAFVSFYLLGFVVSTFLYTFLSLKVRSRLPWKVSLLVSFGCLVFLYGVIVYGLRVDLYEGRIILLLRRVFFGY